MEILQEQMFLDNRGRTEERERQSHIKGKITRMWEREAKVGAFQRRSDTNKPISLGITEGELLRNYFGSYLESCTKYLPRGQEIQVGLEDPEVQYCP